MNSPNFSPQAFAINPSYSDKSCFMNNTKTAAGTGGHANASMTKGLGAC